MEAIWIISLKIWAKIEVTKHMFCSHTSLYHIGFVWHLFFKCDKMRLSSVFFYRKNTSHSPEKWLWTKLPREHTMEEMIFFKILSLELPPARLHQGAGTAFIWPWQSAPKHYPSARLFTQPSSLLRFLLDLTSLLFKNPLTFNLNLPESLKQRCTVPAPGRWQIIAVT